MPNYVHKQLIRYKPDPPRRTQYSPYEPKPIHYGKLSDDKLVEPESPLNGQADKKYIQQVVGSFLYYTRAVDLTILLSLSAIAAKQANPTERTMQRVQHLLQYMHTNPNAIIQFRASNMVLNIHSDASYLTASRGRSRACGYFFLGSVPRNGENIKLNGNIAITCTILKLVDAQPS